MDKKLIWAVVLSMLVLMVWYRIFVPKFIPPPPQSLPMPSEKIASGEPKKETLKSAASLKAELTQKTQSREIKETEDILETPFARITVDSRGAAVKHWQIKEEKRNSKSVSVVKETTLIDLVNHPSIVNLIPVQELPLATFPELNFSRVIEKEGSKNRLLWHAALPSGVEFRKEYIFEEQSETAESFPFIKLILSFSNPKKEPVKIEKFSIGWDKGLGTTESERKENADVTRALAYPSPTKEAVAFKKITENKMDYKWVGVDNRYFLFAMLPKNGFFDRLETEKSKTNEGKITLIADSITLNSKETKTFEIQLYGGPKGYTTLKKFGLGLEHAVDFGTFGFLGKWALKAMNRVHHITRNYGWSIIILTCILQVLLLPLSLKSYQSMAAMKRIQPKIQELQKRYKDDAKRLNQEMLQLYRESKTNPFGGCLPMILQIPVFWAFFTMLRNSIELRGAPWIFWIKDLSQRDPYYVLPIVMGAGMFFQQKISGSVGDPTQAKMMMLMPVIFTFMFMNFPSGLVLYWLTNSILSMLTQYFFMNRNTPKNILVKV